MNKQKVIFKDLEIIRYGEAWDYQNELINKNLEIKTELRNKEKNRLSFAEHQPKPFNSTLLETEEFTPETSHYLLFCEHPPVYTLGKSGHMENVLLSNIEMKNRNIEFFKTNRGGDITFHGLQQVVGYPILDLEKFTTDIGKYLRNLEEVVIKTVAEYGIKGDRSKGETGVWIEPDLPGRERKICAIGIRCSRWVTMHGFALNVNTDLDYFSHIIPCGIQGKQVTSIQKESGNEVDFNEVKRKIQYHFEDVFNVALTTE